MQHSTLTVLNYEPLLCAFSDNIFANWLKAIEVGFGMQVLTEAHVAFVKSESGFLLREDVLCWAKWYGRGEDSWFETRQPHIRQDSSDYLSEMMDKLFLVFREFRSLFDYRLNAAPGLKYHMTDRFPRATELHFNCPSIGPRFFIQHGHNTYVFAKEIGTDFFVNHNVTIGSNYGIPRIGDRVSVRTGAVVIGPITIGDDAMIGANAVVSSDVPDGYAAYAPRALIRPRTIRTRSG